jgi:AAA+ ATPase superfamily predicted ATPase
MLEMSDSFLNRFEEMGRLESLFSVPMGSLCVLWGRRRLGKTRLLVEWCKRHDGIYTVADQSSEKIQRKIFSSSLEEKFPGFGDVEYPDWYSLLKRISAEAIRNNWRGPCVFDEFPYLVEQSQELPSVFQKWIDHEVRESGLIVAIAGSSRRMMHGIVLDADAPLYGRARELMKIEPLAPGHISEVFPDRNIQEQLELYLCFGGTPYYWDLIRQYPKGSPDSILDYLVLNPLGPLHIEPEKLVSDETSGAVSARPVLDAIGFGAHKVSEIAGRTGKPATSLSKVFKNLVDLGLVEREIPYGESEKTSKKSLYRICDPFFHLWFQVVGPHRSFLTKAPALSRIAMWQAQKDRVLAVSWEALCRQVVTSGIFKGTGIFSDTQWDVAGRYWHANSHEWDIVSVAMNNSAILLGEVKWFTGLLTKSRIEQWTGELIQKGVPAPFYSNKPVLYALFVSGKVPEDLGNINGVRVIGGDEVLKNSRKL